MTSHLSPTGAAWGQDARPLGVPLGGCGRRRAVRLTVARRSTKGRAVGWVRTVAASGAGVQDADRLSGGRLILGLGAGDIPLEFAQFGLAYPAFPERAAALAADPLEQGGPGTGVGPAGDARPLAGPRVP